jgi:hypothetical protein
MLLSKFSVPMINTKPDELPPCPLLLWLFRDDVVKNFNRNFITKAEKKPIGRFPGKERHLKVSNNR